ncbi:MAG: hypothetical protein C4536_09175 [Actinobacteria bacterium]|nr:MAG: hypothetical protein C4536_09175 [Actinomycetota bacterium]
MEVGEATVKDKSAILRLPSQLWRATEKYYEPSHEIDVEAYYRTLHAMLTSLDFEKKHEYLELDLQLFSRNRG